MRLVKGDAATIPIPSINTTALPPKQSCIAHLFANCIAWLTKCRNQESNHKYTNLNDKAIRDSIFELCEKFQHESLQDTEQKQLIRAWVVGIYDIYNHKIDTQDNDPEIIKINEICIQGLKEFAPHSNIASSLLQEIKQDVALIAEHTKSWA